ncbi:ferrochelatase [Sphingosinicella microcystinivorans]|uniref:ferrochelatase n=1 Tax=Sphingosinicella microcystinivorans TaxID=335406 RepID=UPI0022F3E8C8|nr:ferrochelatase [Sphingosinicella microcystinivorans]WBX82562.1 ferrochelatase [Sphingosinicella microcystinivorans]
MQPEGHPLIVDAKVGVLIVNLGSPDAPEPAAVKRYLKEFLSDPRVVEIPALVWQPILRGIILNTRPAKSAALYASIWDRARGDSPLRVITADQAAGLQAVLRDVTVDFAMRYGNPSIPVRLDALRAAGCTRILVMPLYPQYSAATTATVVDKVGASLKAMRWQPAVRFLPPYHDDPLYISALAEDARTALAALDFEPDVLVASFHGMPERTLRLGDPYHCQAQKTARLLREALGRDEAGFRTAFQSRFGKAEWLKPYLDRTLEALPGEGVRKVAVIAPGFSADCIETLEEIAIRARETFLHAGGTHFACLRCLNAGPEGMRMLTGLAQRELAGWRESGH